MKEKQAYVYAFVIGDFDMNEQSYTHTSDAPLNSEQIKDVATRILRANPRAAYCHPQSK